MKSSSIILAGALATAVFASPNYDQMPTVTVTQSCLSGQTSAAASHDQASAFPYQDGASTVTITVTETMVVPPMTVTVTSTANSIVTVTHTTTFGGQLPPSPDVPTTYTTSATTTTPPSAAYTHHVDVGTFNGTVKFVPDNVKAAIGDVVEYNFLAKSHSLTQSEFLTPCTFNGGFDTGLNQSNPKNVSGLFIVPFPVTTLKPQWFYCKQPGPSNHCGLGMVFGLNPGNKMDAFRQNAIRQNGNKTTTTPPTTTSTATASITTVTVGLDKGKTLKFSPAYLPKVAPGQTIHFDFRAANHTLTESSLENPCKKLSGTTIDTNFQNVNKLDIPELKPFDLPVTDNKPRFFYCKQANGTPNGHCSKGMVFSINTDEATNDLFLKNAEATLPKIKGRTRA